MAAASCAQRKAKSSFGTAVYRRRQPERSVVYQVVQGHLETWLAGRRHTEEGFPVVATVEQDFRKYLECGILANGFARARCTDCGYNVLIAFSCKGRGICPSCNTRRMVETAAHLVDILLMRFSHKSRCGQWVLFFPKRLRYFLSCDSDLLNRVFNF